MKDSRTAPFPPGGWQLRVWNCWRKLLQFLIHRGVIKSCTACTWQRNSITTQNRTENTEWDFAWSINRLSDWIIHQTCLVSGDEGRKQCQSFLPICLWCFVFLICQFDFTVTCDSFPFAEMCPWRNHGCKSCTYMQLVPMKNVQKLVLYSCSFFAACIYPSDCPFRGFCQKRHSCMVCVLLGAVKLNVLWRHLENSHHLSNVHQGKFSSKIIKCFWTQLSLFHLSRSSLE